MKSNLVILALTELFGGFIFSLLSPFYTKEAASKGVSVFETGLVYGSVFITTIVFSPIFGTYIGVLGAKRLFVYGTFLAGAANVLFGFLQWVEGTYAFLSLSLAIRFTSAVGEAALFSSAYPLAVQAANKSYRSTVLAVMETMFGLGLMVGPGVGGLLYQVSGFCLPFAVCGGALIVCAFLSAYLLDEDDAEDAEDAPKPTYLKLLRVPTVLYSCLSLAVTSLSVSWYLPSLQPFLEANFQLKPATTGVIFMLDGATYAIFSPFWGWILDNKNVSPLWALFWGNVFVILGFSMLGPLPGPLSWLLPSNVYLVAAAMCIHGFGVAANFITTLTYMLSASVEDTNLADGEQTRAMVTSLWFINECIGGYLGSVAGGLAYDLVGFENGTAVVVLLQLASLLTLPVLWRLRRRRRRNDDDEERLLIDKGDDEV